MQNIFNPVHFWFGFLNGTIWILLHFWVTRKILKPLHFWIFFQSSTVFKISSLKKLTNEIAGFKKVYSCYLHTGFSYQEDYIFPTDYTGCMIFAVTFFWLKMSITFIFQMQRPWSFGCSITYSKQCVARPGSVAVLPQVYRNSVCSCCRCLTSWNFR